MTSKLPVSAIILAHQFDHKLKKAFNSIQFCREIIIVNNGAKIEQSDFKTESQLNILKLSDQSINNFSQVRNWAMKQTKFDWVLFVDSDEYLANPDQAAQIIANAIKTDHAAFTFNRSDIFKGFELNFGEAGRQPQARLLKRDLTKFNRPVHETVQIKTKQRPQKLSVTLLHQAHQNINQFLAAINQYAQKEAQYRYKNTNNWTLLILWQLVCFPAGKFVYNYFLKLGFLDQMPGLIYASLMSFHSILVRIHWWQLVTNDSP